MPNHSQSLFWIISTRCYFSIVLPWNWNELSYMLSFSCKRHSKQSCTFQGNIFLRDNGGPTKIMLHSKSDFVNTSLLHHNEFLVNVRNAIKTKWEWKTKMWLDSPKQGLEVIVYRTSKLWAIFAGTHIWTHYLVTLKKNTYHINV